METNPTNSPPLTTGSWPTWLEMSALSGTHLGAK